MAEAPTSAGAGPASGSGFSDLARYLFGGNQEALGLQMTTPVFNEVAPGSNTSVTMQFVMERRCGWACMLGGEDEQMVGRIDVEHT